MKHYVWWVEGKTGGTGEWSSKEDAEKALVRLKPMFSNCGTQKVVKYEAEQCRCGRWTRKDLLDGIGACLNCDHVMGDVMSDIEKDSKNIVSV